MGFQITGNTFIDSTRSAIFNANTTVANNFTVQITDRTVYVATSPMQGTVSGYVAGGATPSASDVIDKYPFASFTTATDIGNLTVARSGVSGQSSSTEGFTSGGYVSPAIAKNEIDKFPFSSDTNASDAGDLSLARSSSSGQSSIDDGYVAGGGVYSPATLETNNIDKFPFATFTTATDIGDLTQVRRNLTGHSSTTHGYASGGDTTPGSVVSTNVIDKFPFATDTNASDVGDLVLARWSPAGQSSKTHGYTSGGRVPPPRVSLIDKFQFVTDNNATDVGNLTQERNGVTGNQSTTEGYAAGGNVPPFTDTVDKFPFSIDTNATDVGNLSQSRDALAGQQD